MLSHESIQTAVDIAKKQANAIIEFRNQELSKRVLSIDEGLESLQPVTRVELQQETLELLGSRGRSVLIAEGDSWFDYPRYDILRILEDHYGYDVESVAHKGDRVEEMAYSDGQLEKFTRLIEKNLRRGAIPRAVLLSGGGNDLAPGKEFAMLLNHASSSLPGLNDSIAEGIIDERLKMAYLAILTKVTTVCKQRTGQVLPIIIHGYDYAVPDGRGFLGGWWLLPGPWLEPGFREKEFSALRDRIEITRQLIDRFNEMLIEVCSLPDFNHVHYIDLRGQLSVSDDYKEDWANELHPTPDGFKKVTALFAQKINSLPHLSF